MGKAARNRRRRRQQQTLRTTASDLDGMPPTAVRGGTKAAVDIAAKIMDDTRMPCRATFSDDPMLGGPKATVSGINPDGSVITDAQEIQPFPVVFFEPSRVLAVKDLRTTEVHDARMEAIIGNGFHRIPRGIMVNFPADGWGLHRTPSGLMLRDQFGGVWADGAVSLDPAWISEATSQGWVTVFYGPKLGVRIPPGMTEETYTLQHRIAEFREGRSRGLCAAANVRWHPIPSDETLNWVLLPPGALGQPLPVAYVPQFNFTPHGGPNTFGFIPTPDNFAQIPRTQRLLGDATPTDFDLVQPHLDNDINFVAGYRKPIDEAADTFTTWQQAAHNHGHVLVITGHGEMPAGPELRHQDPETVIRQVRQVLRDSYAAIVPIRDTPRLPPPT